MQRASRLFRDALPTLRRSRARGRRTAVLLVAAGGFSYGLGSALPGALAARDSDGESGKSLSLWPTSSSSASSREGAPSAWAFWTTREEPKSVVERIRAAVGL